MCLYLGYKITLRYQVVGQLCIDKFNTILFKVYFLENAKLSDPHL